MIPIYFNFAIMVDEVSLGACSRCAALVKNDYESQNKHIEWHRTYIHDAT